jgi:hypothetical protein
MPWAGEQPRFRGVREDAGGEDLAKAPRREEGEWEEDQSKEAKERAVRDERAEGGA